MGEHGQVIAVEEDMLTVRLERIAACAKCKRCIAGYTEKEMLMKAINSCEAKVDDWVNIEVETNFFLTAVFFMYVLPLFGLMLGFAIGYFMAPYGYQDWAAFLLGLFLMFCVYGWVRKNEWRWQRKENTPVATFVVNK